MIDRHEADRGILLPTRHVVLLPNMKPGTVMDVSKNGGVLAVLNEDGWTALDLVGREGEISHGDTVFAQDWQAQGREELLFNNEVFSADFRGCGDKKWALGQLGK